MGREEGRLGYMVEKLRFPVTVVGSWPRPPGLVQALRQREAGALSSEEFSRVADRAVQRAVRYQEEAGVDIVTDGEQRRDNFYSFVVEKLAGMKLMTVSDLLDYVKDRGRFEEVLRALDVPAFAIKSPIVVDRIGRKAGLALDEVDFLMRHTSKPVKVPLPGPYLLTKSSWFQGLSDRAYASEEELAKDVVTILREEVVALRERGVHFIQFDEPVLSQVAYGEEGAETFMCAALSSRKDPSQELEFAVRLMNAVTEGSSGVKFGVHVCRGNWSRKENVLLSGNYGPLLPYLLAMNVDQLVLEFATPRAGELEVFKEYPTDKEIGLGVVNPKTDEVEGPASIVERVREALRYFEPEKVYLNPDCGFGTFAERAVSRPKTAFLKLRALAEAARTLREQYA